MIIEIKMSAQAFFDKVDSTPSIQKKVIAIGTENFDSLSSFAKELGFIVSSDDLKHYMNELINNGSDLNEDELNSLSGGTWGENNSLPAMPEQMADSGW